MRELTGHVVNPANDQLKISVLDGAGPGGANHLYIITGFRATEANNPALNYHPDSGPGVMTGATLLFQNGAISEVGVNGLTHEALIEVLIDRLIGFQTGAYQNHYNENALRCLEDARTWLQRRTRDRMAQGVEGTMAVGRETPPSAPPVVHPVGKATNGNPIMQYFSYDHLPKGPLKEVSAHVCDLAHLLDADVPTGAEKSAGMRKLLEAKDCFVRAVLPAR
jgi:hypothetical protein